MRRLIHHTLLLLILLGSPALLGQGLAPATITEDGISTLQKAVSTSEAFSDEERAALEERLQEASQSLRRAADDRAKADAYRRAIESGPGELARYEGLVDELERSTPGVEDQLGSNPSLRDIEGELEVLGAQRRALAEQRSAELEAQGRAKTQGPELQQRLATVTRELETLAAPAVRDDSLPGRVAAAGAAARREALEAERDQLELQLRGAPAMAALRSAKLAWLDASLGRLDAQLAALRDAAATTRQSLARERIETTRRLLGQLSDAAPEATAFAETTIALIEEKQALTAKVDQARYQLAALRELKEYTEADFSLTRRRVEVAGLEGKLGQVLMTRLGSLPGKRALQSLSTDRNSEIAEVSLATIDSEEALRATGDRSTFLRKNFGDTAAFDRRERRILDQLYDQRRTLLREKLEAQNTLLRLLVDTNSATEQLIATTRDYQAFLTGNLLWIRSYHWLDPSQLLEQLLALVDPAPLLAGSWRWQRTLAEPLFMGFLLLLALLLLFRRRASAARESLLSVPIGPRDESPRKILTGLALGLVLCLPLPLALILLAWAMSLATAGAAEVEALARGLGAAAVALFLLAWLQDLTGRLGTGRRLLKWNAQKLDTLRGDLPWLSILVPTAVGAIVVARSRWVEDTGGPLAALGTFTLSAAILFATVRILRSSSLRSDRLATLLFQALALIAAAIVTMHFTGQLFAAQMYLHALGRSLAAVSLTLLVINIAQRVILIYEGRIERRQRAELKAQARDGEDLSPEQEISDRDVDAVASLSDAQAQLLGALRLLLLGGFLWLIWSPALPAVALLDNVTLWAVTDPGLPPGELRAVSLATLIIAFIVAAVTVVLVKHVPPLVQVLMMEYASVSPGVRYAAGMLLQYVIIGIGASISLSLLGFAWSKVQWLVAALGVGIGFGLQEIVANFISGIILLFERPIRVGDIISVSGHDGVVVNINPRATVISTFDNKELLIPNKDLITGVVNNWSLTSSKLRGVIPVGIAYGSDVRKAIAILYDVAKENPRVLEDPAPLVTFEDFGDNALVLWLRCYTDSDYLQRWTELRTEIYDRLNDAAITIAFPQRDVHLDAAAPIPVQVVKTSAPGDARDR